MIDVSRYYPNDVILEELNTAGDGYNPPKTIHLSASELPVLIKELFKTANDADQIEMAKAFAVWLERKADQT